MGIFRMGHKHVSPETLTEYLDGRLRAQVRERLESVISGCADCRHELEDLRDTAAMLRQLPVFTPRRSFVMAAPPIDVPEHRPSPFRAPQWAYAGAASLAALALAVLVSVDASGLVAPDLPGTGILKHEDTPPVATGSEVAVQESAADGGADRIQGAAPPEPVAAEAIQVERETAVEAPAAAVMEAQAAAAPEMQAESPAEKSLAAPATKLQAVDEPADRSAQLEQASPPATAESAPVQLEQASDARPETVEILTLPTVVSDRAASEPVQVQELPIAADESAGPVDPGTPLSWRLLEGLAAAMFLVLAAVFFLRRRASRRF